MAARFGMHGSKKTITHKLCPKAWQKHIKHGPHKWREEQTSTKGVKRVVTYDCAGWK